MSPLSFPTSPVIPAAFNRPSVMPDVGNRLSVIPDVFNRESKAFPRQCRTNEGTEEKNTGFPLKTCGNDRGGEPAGMTEERTGGHDRRGERRT